MSIEPSLAALIAADVSGACSTKKLQSSVSVRTGAEKPRGVAPIGEAGGVSRRGSVVQPAGARPALTLIQLRSFMPHTPDLQPGDSYAARRRQGDWLR